MELNNTIRRKKDLSTLTVLKSFLCVWKVVGHFCNFQAFCQQSLLNDFFQAIADDQPLYATLQGETEYNIS